MTETPTLGQRLDAAAEAYRVKSYLQLRKSKAERVRIWVPKPKPFAPEHFKDTDTTTGKD